MRTAGHPKEIVVPYLHPRPDLDQLRHQAKDLLRAAKAGDETSLDTIRAVSDRLTLSSAQLAIARHYGFASWPKLTQEVDRRAILDDRDLARLDRLIKADPALATTPMEHWADHRRGVAPINYVAMLRFDAGRLGLTGDLSDTGAMARALLASGAPVNGQPGEPETPLITAASYGDADVARALVESGADINAVAAPDAGGVPGGTALLHAAVFGMTDVVDVLVAAGATVHGIEEAAAAGDIDGWLTPDTDPAATIRALVMAADHQRLDVIDQLIAAGTPVDAVDEAFGGHPLRTAAQNGRPKSVGRLLAHGADPRLRDDEGRTPLDLCRPPHRSGDRGGHAEVEAILLAALSTDVGDPSN
jgi:ankyrin repeat protein